MATKARRILLTSDELSFYKLLGFAQNTRDGSIYANDINEFRSGLLYTVAGDSIVAVPTAESEKVSIHASGQLHVKHDGRQVTRLCVDGALLNDEPGLNSGVRHLLTLFPTEPTRRPAFSPPLRDSDVWVRGPLAKPYAFIFFAVPAGITQLDFQISFHIDELRDGGPDLGSGSFDLVQHRVHWFAYGTSGMERWPKTPHVAVTEGASLPLFLGVNAPRPATMTEQKLEPLSIQFFLPEYELVGTELTIRAVRQSEDAGPPDGVAAP